MIYCREAQEGAPEGVENVALLWTDPPFGTGKRQADGGGGGGYMDVADTGYVLDGLRAWLPAMACDGVVVVCVDYRLTADVVMAMRGEGWEYMGEIIWEFGLGRPRTTWWPVRHANLLTFRKSSSAPFDASAVPRVKRLAPGKGYGDDRPAGSVWWHTMSNTDPERVGRANQKPLSIVTPFVEAHSEVGGLIVDPFAGSGTVGAAALALGRRWVCCDSDPLAVACMEERLGIW